MYKVRAKATPQNGCVYLVPLGDTHYGSREFTDWSEEKLKGYIKWILERPNAYTFLMGDLTECGTITSPSKPFQEAANGTEQFLWAVNTFRPLAEKGRILGAIMGNHELQYAKTIGTEINRTKEICSVLGVTYCGCDAFLFLDVSENNTSTKRVYYCYFVHGSGGGRTRGGKINVLSRIELICEADLYAIGHVHDSLPFRKDRWSPLKGNLVRRKVAFTTTGSFVDYCESTSEPSEGYAVQRNYEPVCIGAPRIRFEADHHRSKDIHISI